MTILTKGRSEETKMKEGVGKACMCDLEPGDKNFFIAKFDLKQTRGYEFSL